MNLGPMIPKWLENIPNRIFVADPDVPYLRLSDVAVAAKSYRDGMMEAVDFYREMALRFEEGRHELKQKMRSLEAERDAYKAALTKCANEADERCTNCGHVEAHNGPEGKAEDDHCTFPGCHCGFDSRGDTSNAKDRELAAHVEGEERYLPKRPHLAKLRATIEAYDKEHHPQWHHTVQALVDAARTLCAESRE